MVSRLGFSSKHPAAADQQLPPRSSHSPSPPPPPPYKEGQHSASPILLAETTTTTTEVVTTTTHTTTHFFSLPHWTRKRASPSHIPMPGTRMDGQLSLDAPRPLRLEKDLPPTPWQADADAHGDGLGPMDTSHAGSMPELDQRERNSSLDSMPPPPRRSLQDGQRKSSMPNLPMPQTPSTSALAQAALGIGLPHGLATPPAVEPANISMLPSPSPSEGRLSVAQVRKARSSQKLRESTLDVGEPARRNRGVSLGPAALDRISTDVKSKEKESAQPTPTITRRPSFWQRKKTAKQTEPPPSPTLNRADQSPSLPYVPPVSPFEVELKFSTVGTSSTSPSQPQHPAALGRSRSARASTSSSSSSPTVPYTPVARRSEVDPRRLKQRPSTAGGHARRHSFLDETQPPLAASPSPMRTTFPATDSDLRQPSMNQNGLPPRTDPAPVYARVPPSPTPQRRSEADARRQKQRPATAGGHTRTRSRSFIDEMPRPLTASPASSPMQAAFPMAEFESRRLSTSLNSPPQPPSPVFARVPPPPPPQQQRRPRSATNPLHRLSINFFSSNNNSSSTFPTRPPTPPPPTPVIPPPSSLSQSVRGAGLTASPGGSAANSPRPSLSKHPAATPVPKPQEDGESPEIYLLRLRAAVSKAEIAGVLAHSGDTFHKRALQAYIDGFTFFDDPLDVALRKLLMDVGLPRETQQIDRVMEAFAHRYTQCNPALFTSEDQPYILAFSLIMLHTDAFNKSNKRKMTKADYIKNTRLPGVSPEVLDCFYDNICFAPFIFIEDPLDVNGQRGVMPEATGRKLSTFGTATASAASMAGNGGSTLLGKAPKIDPYYLITNNLLNPLRVNVEAYVPLENPLMPQGIGGPWDQEEVRRSFAKASVIEVGAVDHNRAPMATPMFSLNVGGMPSPLGSIGAFPDIVPSTGEVWSLRVTKAGLLNRKDDVLDGGRKASNRKWRPWSVILTGSQLLLFRDPGWATALLESADAGPEGHVIFPHATVFRPDELWSLRDAIAVFDCSYTKYENVFRLALPDGRQILFQSSAEHELDQWLSRINYASAFKTAGVRMRALGMTGKDLELTGVAAATSHLHDKQNARRSNGSQVHSWDGHDLIGMLTTPPGSPTRPDGVKPGLKRRVTMMSGRPDVDMEAPAAPEVDGADLFKATFDEVKAELAAYRWSPTEETHTPDERPLRAHNSDSAIASPPMPSRPPPRRVSTLPSRSQIILSKVQDLESKLAAAQAQLETDMRFVRNVAALTPFQRTTRDRLTTALQGVAKRVFQLRLDIAKLVCHRDVLVRDMEAEEQDRAVAKRTALRAATDTLNSRKATRIPPKAISLPMQPATEVKIELSSESPTETKIALPPNSSTESTLSPLDRDDSGSHRPESSLCESFHSAVDNGFDWPESAKPMSVLSPGHVFASPSPGGTPSTELGTRSSGGSFPFPVADSSNTSARRDSSPSPRAGTPLSLSTPMDADDYDRDAPASASGHEKFYTAPEIPVEQAEEWDKTRCAKRVSLVRVPSDLRLSGRHVRRKSELEQVDAQEEDEEGET